MKGNNLMILNEATVMEALQLWLASKYPNDTPVVTHVAQLSTMGSQGYHDQFEVRLAEHGATLS